MQTDKNKSNESEMSIPIGTKFLSAIKFELYSLGSLSSLLDEEFIKFWTK
jgi:hypothetical protein